MRTLPLCFYTLFLCDNCCGDVDELVNSYQSKMGMEHFLSMRSPTILSSVVVSQPATHKKKKGSYSKHTIYIFMANVFLESKIFHQTMFFYSKLHTTPRRHVCFVWHAVFFFCCFFFSSASNFFASIAVVCIKMWPQVKIATDVYIFRLCHSI